MKKLLFSMIWCLVSTAAAVAQGTFQMAGPYEVVARDGQYRSTKAGSEIDASIVYADYYYLEALLRLRNIK